MGLFDRRRRPEPQVFVLKASDIQKQMLLSITASVVDVTDRDAVEKLRRVVQPWQLQALTYRTSIGEIRYAADFYARPMRRLRWYVGEVEPDGSVVETKNEVARAVMGRVRDPGGGLKKLITEYARLMFCTGEALLLYTPEHPDRKDSKPKPEAWEMLSTVELRPQADDSWIRYSQGVRSDGEPIVDESRVYRLWQRDTTYSDLADAPMRAVIDLCEELAILTLVVRARATLRLAGNGLLFIPDSITVPTPVRPANAEGATPMQDDPMQNKVLRALVESTLGPIEDQGDPSAALPLFLSGPAEAGEKIRHVTIRDTSESFPENELRNQTIHRLFLGLDMPPESGEGMGQSTHWNAWQIERDAWRHAEPIAEQFGDDMTTAYLYPSLVDEKVPNPEKYVWAYDASEILTNPDRGADAKDALTTGAIGYPAYRKAMGWEETDAPTDDELPVMQMFFGKGIEDPEAPEGSQDGSDSEQGAPATEDDQGQEDGDDQQSNGASASLVATLRVAADLAVARHREIAGGRIRSKANGCQECREALADVGNEEVAAVLGLEECTSLGAADADRLMDSRANPLVPVAMRMGLSEDAAVALARRAREHAARTLWMRAAPEFPEGTVLTVLDRDGKL